ncbi:HNH endonuclease [Verrucomicrobium spinosum]|uniref:HNH endonuclease n=1 Tax=Verrucomicrobium spinosum TaxID=2736 RepID=UPI0001745EDA|nr:HNH endonuclease [Verrucomicrobium spinosum]
MASGKRWNRDELLIVLNLYEKLPFGQFDQRQKVIQDVAKRLQRTASSLAMKLGNLASLDPVLHARGRKGLPGASELDKEVWTEFQRNRDVLVPESETRIRALFEAGVDDELDVVQGQGVKVRKRTLKMSPDAVTSVPAQVMARRGQQVFRQAVLNAYDSKCCITGLHIRELLVASHILPWSDSVEARLDHRNGLCLNRLHDAAFDQGLITLDEDLRVVVSRSLRSEFAASAVAAQFRDYEGVRIVTPWVELAPDPRYLAHHREHVFVG